MEDTAHELLQSIISQGWAKPRPDLYMEKLRATDPEIRRLVSSGNEGLVDDSINARYDRDHVGEFVNLPMKVAVALFEHLDITAESDQTFVHLVTEKPDASMFPASNHAYCNKHKQYRRVVFITPSSVDIAKAHDTAASLFFGHHSRYDLGGLAIEMVTEASGSKNVRLHLQVADRPKESGVHSRHSYGYVTIDTDGSVAYERFWFGLDERWTAEATSGVKPKECLLTAGAVATPPGQAANLDHMFPGAKDRLAEDLRYLPQFIRDIATASMRRIRIPGF